MSDDTEIIRLAPKDSQALSIVTGDEWINESWQQEQFARYESACHSGLIAKLCQMTCQHGTLEGNARHWVTMAGEVKLECVYYLQSGGLQVSRNGELLINDYSGEIVFDIGQGNFLRTLLLEDARLTRQAKQEARLSERLQETVAANRRTRNI